MPEKKSSTLVRIVFTIALLTGLLTRFVYLRPSRLEKLSTDQFANSLHIATSVLWGAALAALVAFFLEIALDWRARRGISA